MAVVSVPVYWLIGRYFLVAGVIYLEHLRFLLQPFVLSALRAEFHEDMWAEIKLYIYFLVCTAWVLGASMVSIDLVGLEVVKCV